ncbi:hypothetical protein D7X33_29485 [Butyricicoccus sp. 1XD8-22]|nr:hypothetical protein D7X33_29485 [Butyricicoccus sp. 1XD8-22]
MATTNGTEMILHIIEDEINANKKRAHEEGYIQAYKIIKQEVDFILGENIPPSQKILKIAEYFNTNE